MANSTAVNSTAVNSTAVIITAVSDTKAITQVNSTDTKIMDTKIMDIRIMGTTLTAITDMGHTIVPTDTVVISFLYVNCFVILYVISSIYTFKIKMIGYPGGNGYYGRPQGILGTVGNVLDGLLGMREGEKKPAVDGDASAAPVVVAAAPEAVDPVFPEADSVPQIPVKVDGILPEPALVSEGVPSAGEEVIFQ